MTNHYAYQMIASQHGGQWCWNTDYGCGPQIMAAKVMGCIILAVIIVAHFAMGRKK
jgi:hypothetical protein